MAGSSPSNIGGCIIVVMFFKYGMFSINDDWSIDVGINDCTYCMRYVLNFDLQDYLTSVFLNIREKLVEDIADGKSIPPDKRIIIYAPEWQPKRFVIIDI